MTTDCLIVFTRYPLPGRAKTRLIPALGAEGAASLQRQMTEHTLTQIRRLQAAQSLAVEIWFAGNADENTDRNLMQDWLGTDWTYRTQQGSDLGERLITAVQSAFAAGMQRVVVIGTDCPELDAMRLQQAYGALADHDLVLGPATDGGYYLIGLRQFMPDLFRGIAWSSEVVLQQTLEIAEQLKLTVSLLGPLTDVDRPDDLDVWRRVSQRQISIVIPVLNEANSIERLLHSLLHSLLPDQVEVIVVDGGSQDQTVDLAAAMGAKVITTTPGRATQMNAGAAVATGEVLLFLHADTQLPSNFVPLVWQTLGESGMSNPIVAGAFQLKIAGAEAGLRWVERGVDWRSRWLQLPYGDQALFLRAATFNELGGFANLPIMEDFELVRRLQKLGKIAIAPAAVETSARRWQKLGIWKTMLINQIVIVAYYLGVSPARIARWYRQDN